MKGQGLTVKDDPYRLLRRNGDRGTWTRRERGRGRCFEERRGWAWGVKVYAERSLGVQEKAGGSGVVETEE